MDFFQGFSWAIPKAFSDAIAHCRFEEGDVIYDSQSAYQKWGKALESIKYCIKVKYPRRSTSITIKEKTPMPLALAKANWNSEVKIELIDFSNETSPKLITTTQGRLFSLLWKGKFEILDANKQNPPPPLFLNDIKKKNNKILREALPSCNKIALNNSFFVLAYDPTNEVSRKKHLEILDALNREYGCKFYQLDPRKSGFEHWDNVFPVISINLYVIEKGGYEQIERSLKKVLYKPSKETKKDRFRLSVHGILMVKNSQRTLFK